MSRLKELITTVVKNYLATVRLSDMQIGVIKTVNPISIQLENNKTLPAEFFIFPSRTKFL